MPSSGAYTDQDVDQPKKGQYSDEDLDSPYTESGALASPPIDRPISLAGVKNRMAEEGTRVQNYSDPDVQMNRAANSPTPMTNAVGVMAPITAARQVVGGKLGAIAGKHLAPYVGANPESGETIGGLLGGGLFGLGEHEPPGTPKPAGIIDKAIAPDVAPGMSEEATANMQEPVARRGTEKLFKAAAPTASDQDFRERLSEATPDIAQLAKEKQLTTKGGVFRPDFRPREFVNNLSEYMDRLWQKEYAPQIKDAGNSMAPLDEVKEAMRNTISQVDKEKQPGLVNSLNEELSRMPDHESVSQLEARRMQLSDKLNRYYRANPSEQVAMENQNFNVAATKAEYNAVLNTLDSSLKANGQAGGMGPRGRYGNLSEVRAYMAKQMNPTEQATTMQHIGQILLRRGPERLVTGAMANPSAGRQIGQGLKLLGRSDIPAPEPTPGPREPGPIRMRLPQTASTAGLTPMEREPGTPPVRPGIRSAGTTGKLSQIEAPVSSLETSESANQPREVRKTPWGQQTGKPLSDIRDKQAIADKLLKVVKDPLSTAEDKAAATGKLKEMGVKEAGSPTPPAKNVSPRYGKRNIGQRVNR